MATTIRVTKRGYPTPRPERPLAVSGLSICRVRGHAALLQDLSGEGARKGVGMTAEELCAEIFGWEADRAWRGTWVAENSRSWAWFNTGNRAMARCGFKYRRGSPPCNLLAQVSDADGAHRCDQHNAPWWRRWEQEHA
jgi:hypothetical protein